MKILLAISFLVLSLSSLAQNPKIENFIHKWSGVKYKWGGRSKKGIDCSGLTMIFYKEVYNLKISPTCNGQYNTFINVPFDSIVPGDLIFFKSTRSKTKCHCGIYLGNGNFLHSPHKKDKVKISNLYDGDYTERFRAVKRFSLFYYLNFFQF